MGPEETGKETEEISKEIEETNKDIKKTNKEINSRIINLLEVRPEMAVREIAEKLGLSASGNILNLWRYFEWSFIEQMVMMRIL